MLQLHQWSGCCQVVGEDICIMLNLAQFPHFWALSGRMLFRASIHNKLHRCRVSSVWVSMWEWMVSHYRTNNSTDCVAVEDTFWYLLFFCMSHDTHECKKRKRKVISCIESSPRLFANWKPVKERKNNWRDRPKSSHKYSRHLPALTCSDEQSFSFITVRRHKEKCWVDQGLI